MPPIANIWSLQECLYGDFNRTLVDKYCMVVPIQQLFYPLPPKKKWKILSTNICWFVSHACVIWSFHSKPKLAKCHCSKKLLRNMCTFRIHEVTPFQHWRNNFYVKLNIKRLFMLSLYVSCKNIRFTLGMTHSFSIIGWSRQQFFSRNMLMYTISKLKVFIFYIVFCRETLQHTQCLNYNLKQV
jgi:hypothetical protein